MSPDRIEFPRGARHGTQYAYRQGCGCDDCRAGMNERNRRRRQARLDRGEPAVLVFGHGRRNRRADNEV